MPISKLDWAVAALACVAAAQGNAQSLPEVQATLAIEKQQYFVGEPIELIFAARYTGAASRVDLSESDPYGRCGAYHLEVVPDEPERRQPSSGPACAPFFEIQEFDCFSGGMALVKGVETKHTVLLNALHDFSTPGTYTVKVTRHLSYWANFGKHTQPTGQVSASFMFSVVAPPSADSIRDSFSPYLIDLASPNYERRQHAGVVLSTLAAPFLEPYLVQMLSTPDLKRPAIVGLRRLNSDKARKAIFDSLNREGSLSVDDEFALDALAELGDPSYGPQLLRLMKRSKDVSGDAKLLAAAARLDAKTAMTVIQPLLASPNERERTGAVNALAATERGEALPVLVRMLNDASFEVRCAAAHGLVSITRESPSRDGMFWSGEDPAADRTYWSAWLKENPDLPIHPLRECPQLAQR
jgi:HEAT repeat protein